MLKIISNFSLKMLSFTLIYSLTNFSDDGYGENFIHDYIVSFVTNEKNYVLVYCYLHWIEIIG